MSATGGEGSTRRDVLAAASAFGIAAAAIGSPAAAQSERPKEDDLLVADDSERTVALTPNDIPLGGPPVMAWPMEPASDFVRRGSRLNKVLLVRLDSDTLKGVTRERAAEGIVAYSAICPHAGCEVSKWVEEQKVFECSCHYSIYDPRDGAAVLHGPSPRSLPALPLKIVDGKLAVAKPFTTRPGIVPS
jgi:rieske iron-sulfur protein